MSILSQNGDGHRRKHTERGKGFVDVLSFVKGHTVSVCFRHLGDYGELSKISVLGRIDKIFCKTLCMKFYFQHGVTIITDRTSNNVQTFSLPARSTRYSLPDSFC